MPVTSALGTLRQEDYKFKDSLGYTARPCPNSILIIAVKGMSSVTLVKTPF